MEGEHTPTIIQLIQLMDLAVIQLKDSLLFFIFPNRSDSFLETKSEFKLNSASFIKLSSPLSLHIILYGSFASSSNTRGNWQILLLLNFIYQYIYETGKFTAVSYLVCKA